MFALLALLFLAPAQDAPRTPDVPYIPTPPEVVTAMLEMAQIRQNDVLYDLGSGDGRLVIEAARRYGVRAVGIDIDPARVRESRDNAARAGVADRVQFIQGDLFETDISPATVVTMFLLPSLNLKLQPKLLKELTPGTRLVSHAFDMGEWLSDQERIVGGRHLYRWVIDSVRRQLAAPADGTVIRHVDVVTTYDATRQGTDWRFATPPVDLDEPTYLQFLDRFRTLIFPEVQSHKSWFELFRLLRDRSTGEPAFQYSSIEIVGNTLAVSVGDVGKTATWMNRATGKKFQLTIEGNRVLFSPVTP